MLEDFDVTGGLNLLFWDFIELMVEPGIPVAIILLVNLVCVFFFVFESSQFSFLIETIITFVGIPNVM